MKTKCHSLFFLPEFGYLGSVCLLLILGFMGCAPKSQGLLHRNINQAQQLQAHCQAIEMTSPEITQADSLLKLALVAKTEKNFEDAAWQSDLAATYYKIGILNSDLFTSKKNVENLKAELSADKEKLKGLIEVYQEIKSLRKQ